MPDRPTYSGVISTAVRAAVESRMKAGEITAPLINELARILVGVSNTTGADLNQLVEIARHELDECVVHYKNNSKR